MHGGNQGWDNYICIVVSDQGTGNTTIPHAPWNITLGYFMPRSGPPSQHPDTSSMFMKMTGIQRHAITSKWRRFGVITTSLMRNVSAGWWRLLTGERIAYPTCIASTWPQSVLSCNRPPGEGPGLLMYIVTASRSQAYWSVKQSQTKLVDVSLLIAFNGSKKTSDEYAFKFYSVVSRHRYNYRNKQNPQT